MGEAIDILGLWLVLVLSDGWKYGHLGLGSGALLDSLLVGFVNEEVWG